MGKARSHKRLVQKVGGCGAQLKASSRANTSLPDKTNCANN